MSVHLVTGFRNEEHIKSEDQGSFNASFFGAGQYVMQTGSECAASIIDNNTVRVLDGDILMKGRHIRIKPKSFEDCTIETGTAGINRNDMIVMEYYKNPSNGIEDAYLKVLRGTETEGNPADPVYTNGDILGGAERNQMPLYRVKIEGVVLKSIEKLFSTIPNYQKLAEKYEKEFIDFCKNHLESLALLDSQDEILANTQENQIAGALGVKSMYQELKFVDECEVSSVDGDLVSTEDYLNSDIHAIIKAIAAGLKSAVVRAAGSLANDYAGNSDIGKGIIFGKNADGTFFTLRPILKSNIFQLTKNDTNNLLQITSAGAATFAGNVVAPNISGALKDITALKALPVVTSGGILYLMSVATTGSGYSSVRCMNRNGIGNAYIPIYASSFELSSGDTFGVAGDSVQVQARANAKIRLRGTGIYCTNREANAYVAVYATGCQNPSSRLIKKNIKKMSDEEMDKILDVEVVDFDYKSGFGGKGQHGVIAEQVEDIIPYAVDTPEGYKEEDFDVKKGIDQKVKTVDYSKFVPYLIAKIQNLENRVAELEAEKAVKSE